MRKHTTAPRMAFRKSGNGGRLVRRRCQHGDDSRERFGVLHPSRSASVNSLVAAPTSLLQVGLAVGNDAAELL